MLADFKPAARTSLSDAIVDQLTGLIARGVLKPGDRVPSEKQLCRQLGVGRTSVREALRSLSVVGILESHAGDGTFVSGDRRRYLEKAFQWGLLLDRKVVEDLIETRLMLESQTAFLAARYASSADLAAIERSIEGMAASTADPERFLEFDLSFHLAIAEASQNSILHNLLGMTRGYLQEWIQQALKAPRPEQSRRRAELSVAEHRKILRAMKRGQAEAARRAMTEHILSSSAALRKHLARRRK
ncbi:MAG: FadR family transcriptional regulator [Acidobacteria bacterium]|nr:FadR family transcriptional regulator [Acidobacteriota bacterium]